MGEIQRTAYECVFQSCLEGRTQIERTRAPCLGEEYAGNSLDLHGVRTGPGSRISRGRLGRFLAMNFSLPSTINNIKIKIKIVTLHANRAPRLKCPSCSAPMVGTNPTDFLSSNAAFRQALNEDTVVNIGIVEAGIDMARTRMRNGEKSRRNFLMDANRCQWYIFLLDLRIDRVMIKGGYTIMLTVAWRI